MGSHSTERDGRIPTEQRQNIFALVIYVGGPLGRFLDDLRRELVPGCNPHAHVSLLPPRPLSVDWRVASEQVRDVMEGFPAFGVELTAVGIFPETNVIYLEVGQGSEELRRVHVAMNTGSLEFKDPFPYHPHITLAQELPVDKVAATYELAKNRWREYTGPCGFAADLAVFVQNSSGNCWIDLAEYSLAGSSVKS